MYASFVALMLLSGPTFADKCPLPPVKDREVEMHARRIVINSVEYKVAGTKGYREFLDVLDVCHETEAAVAFATWRSRRSLPITGLGFLALGLLALDPWTAGAGAGVAVGTSISNVVARSSVRRALEGKSRT